jgi:hypothetical protein
LFSDDNELFIGSFRDYVQYLVAVDILFISIVSCFRLFQASQFYLSKSMSSYCKFGDSDHTLPIVLSKIIIVTFPMLPDDTKYSSTFTRRLWLHATRTHLDLNYNSMNF